MTTLSRRTFTIGLGGAALAATLGTTIGSAAEPELTGYVLASRTTGDAPASTVVDLSSGTESGIDVEARTEPVGVLPPVERLFPVSGTAYGIAAFTDVLLVVDAARAVATEIVPYPGTRFDQPLGERGLFPPYQAPGFRSDRYTLLAEVNRVTFVVDMEEATAFDVTVFAGEDPFFQVASFTPDGRRLLLATSEVIVVVDLATMEVARTIVTSTDPTIRSPQLSPDGTRVAFAERAGEGGAVTIRVADLGGEADVSADIPEGFASLRWASDDALVVVTIVDNDSALDRLDVATGRTTRIGVVPGIPANLDVLGQGTRALVWSEPDDARLWRLLDLTADRLIELPDLEGMVSLGPVSREARAVLLGSENDAAIAAAGQRFAVLNTATGELTATVPLTEGQYYTPPVFSPDLRTVAIGSTGADLNELWLINLVDGGLVVVPDHLGAQFAPDGRAFVTRVIGRDTPLEILDTTGSVIRELGAYDRGWWLG